MSATVETQRAAEHLGYWSHIYPPLDCWSVYTVLTDGLTAAKRERIDAMFVHDHDRADRALAEVRELTTLCAAATEGIVLQRARWMASGKVWPLGRLTS